MRADPADFIEAEAREEAEAAASTFLTFDLGGQTLGVAVRRVREILDLKPLTRLPNAPMEVLGVIDVRGASVPILDLAARLGMGARKADPETRIIVFELERECGPPRPVGVLADRVRDVARIEPGAVEPAPETGRGERDLTLGLCRRDGALVVLIDLERALADGVFL